MRLSLVVPCHNVQAYLDECLGSIFDQGYPGVEVIAVDDCSPDRSGAILDRWAAKYPNLSVIHLGENVGLGAARNIGLTHATGEYVWFVDSDDSLTPGSLAAVDAALTELDDPDLLIVDHARSYWWGKVARNVKAGEMRRLAGRRFTAAEEPGILDFLQVAWNKVIRRDVLEREGMSFPVGYYEDTSWTHEAYFTAKSIGVLPQVCVHYRQRRTGSILVSPGRKHFEAVDQWERLHLFLDQHPELEHWRDLVNGRMVRHYLTVINHPRRLAPEDRADFLALVSRQLRTRAKGRASWPKNRRDRVNLELLRRGDIRMFDAMHAAYRAKLKGQNKVRRQVSTARRLARRGVTAASRLDYERRLMERPLDPTLAVFSSLWDRGYQGNPAAIYEAMTRLAPQLRGVWVVKSSAMDSVPEGVETVAPGSHGFWDAMARATYFVNDVNFPDAVHKRQGQIHIQTQHGTPLKHMGIDLMAHPAAAKGMVFRHLLKRADRWDYNISSNEFSTLTWQRAFPSSFATLESGYPRNDILVNATAEDVIDVRQELRIPAGKRAVLFAPTHRDHDQRFTIRADLPALAKALGDDFVLIVRAHYFYHFMPDLDRLAADGVLINASRYPSTERLMIAADALITDYSSIMFDYANLDRPIVVFAPDWRTYQDVRGTYFDIFETSPGLTLSSQDDVAAAFVSGDADGEIATANRQAFREAFCPWDDGRSAERVVRQVMLGEPALPVIPLSERVLPPVPASLDYELPEIVEDPSEPTDAPGSSDVTV